jgi:hypothetical protein
MYSGGKEVEKRHKKLLDTNDTDDVNI